MKNIVKVLLAGTVALSSLSALAADPYKVRVKLSDNDEGAMVYLYDFDKSQKVDSLLANGKEVVFTGEVDEPYLAQIVIDRRNKGIFVLESGSVVVDVPQRKVFGSMLNDRLRDYSDKMRELSEQYRAATTDDQREKIENTADEIVTASLEENSDNPLGLYFFTQIAKGLTPKEFFEYLKKYPDLAETGYAKAVGEEMNKRLATMPGQKFVDFEVVYDGKTSRLSDYVGKGKYVLVDYWASWCGPCIRQIPVIKDLLAEFGDKGLEVLGVAVWDEPANTLRAIESHGITWPCIINAQRIPTDLYGIGGIPCIILYGPDGTILSRDKQSEELKADVRAAFAGTLKID